jgi:hypothetical protein
MMSELIKILCFIASLVVLIWGSVAVAQKDVFESADYLLLGFTLILIGLLFNPKKKVDNGRTPEQREVRLH